MCLNNMDAQLICGRQKVHKLFITERDIQILNGIQRKDHIAIADAAEFYAHHGFYDPDAAWQLPDAVFQHQFSAVFNARCGIYV